MTVVAAAAGAIAGRQASGPRLATPGAVLLIAGLALMWWGLGVFRGDVGANATVRNMGVWGHPERDDDTHDHATPPRGEDRRL